MRKENENINIFIIEEDYRRSKTKQNAHGNFLRKTEPLVFDTQNHESVIKELEKMHSDFEENQELELLPPTEGTRQIETLQIVVSSDPINDLDILASFQEMKTEEQELLEQKQLLLAREQDLHSKLVEAIDKKKADLQDLRNEIQDLHSRCEDLSQKLGELCN